MPLLSIHTLPSSVLQFSWENVKADASRDYSLGHSVKAVTGRWAKGKDVFWYTREKAGEGEDMRARELAMVKQREEELMAEVGCCARVRGCWEAGVCGVGGAVPLSPPRLDHVLALSDERSWQEAMR